MGRFVTVLTSLAFAFVAGAGFAGPACDGALELRLWGGGEQPSGRALNLQDFADQALIAASDVRAAELREASSGGAAAVNLRLTARAAERLSEATAERLGEPIAVLHSGKILVAPIVRERISSGQLRITGGFDVVEAERLTAILAVCAAEQE